MFYHFCKLIIRIYINVFAVRKKYQELLPPRQDGVNPGDKGKQNRLKKSILQTS
jgi:hypothetical protein